MRFGLLRVGIKTPCTKTMNGHPSGVTGTRFTLGGGEAEDHLRWRQRVYKNTSMQYRIKQYVPKEES